MHGMRARGFTYIGLLIFVAIAGVALAGTGTLWSTQARRDREADLLFVGEEFRRAISAYYETAPAGQPPRFPAKLEDLVEDRRFPTVRRHLRKVYADPMTGGREWGVVRGPGDGIVGVYSLAPGAPLRKAGFPPLYAEFAAAKSYRDWRFVHAVKDVALPVPAGGRPAGVTVAPAPAQSPAPAQR